MKRWFLVGIVLLGALVVLMISRTETPDRSEVVRSAPTTRPSETVTEPSHSASAKEGSPVRDDALRSARVEDRPTSAVGDPALAAPAKGSRRSVLDNVDPDWAEKLAAQQRPDGRFPIDKDGIRGAVRAAKPELKECYEGWLKQNPKIGGRIAVGFTITPDEADPTLGKITQVELKDSDVAHVFMESCVLDVFSDLAFIGPKEPVKVTYPLVFSNEEDR